MPRLRVLTLLSLATLFAPAFGQGADPARQNANAARPGTLNYIEGQATMNGQALSAHSVGSAELEAGESLETGTGKVEILLTPGVFLRLNDNSAVRMVSPDLTHTEVQLEHGRAEVEVDQLYRQNDLQVDVNDAKGSAQAKLLKDGLYEIDADGHVILVFDGKAAVSLTDGSQKWTVVKGGHELALNGEPAKAQGFDKKQAESGDGLYSWSNLRSEYLGEANTHLASEYAGAGGFAPGWFWDQGMYAYTWLPGDGMFFSPFGYGFYSPYYVYGGGFIYGGGSAYRGGYGNRGGYVNHGYGNRGSSNSAGARPAAVASGFNSGGGFHGGGGGGGSRGGGGHR